MIDGERREIKDLRKVHSNPKRAVGIEDNDWFYPRERAVKVYQNSDLRHALAQAIDKL